MQHKAVFFHGFDSSSGTNKFTAIQGLKVCVDVDYRDTQYQEVDKEYHLLVEGVIAQGYIPIVVGHSLGGYWALRLAERFNVSCVLLNPQLWPTSELIRDVEEYDIGNEFRAPKYVYLETGDDVIDVERTLEWAKKYADLEVYQGGHHRVHKLSSINTLVERAVRTELL